MGVTRHIEFRTVLHSGRCEASTYLTNTPADVAFKFPNPLICGLMTGQKRISFKGSPAFLLNPGDLLFIPAGLRFEISFPGVGPDMPVECLCLEIPRDRMDELVGQLNESRSRLNAGPSLALSGQHHALVPEAAMPGVVSNLLDLYRTPRTPFRDMQVDLAHLNLLLTVLERCADRLLEPLADEATGLDAVVAAIQSAPGRRYTTTELAQLAGMSEASLFRNFKARFGMPPARYASDYRMQQARKMLAHRAISEISYSLGYANVAHFTRVFRQEVGETPGEMRQRMLQAATLDHETRGRVA